MVLNELFANKTKKEKKKPTQLFLKYPQGKNFKQRRF